MFPLQFPARQHKPPLTLISCTTTSPSSSLIIYLSIAVLTAICFTSIPHTHAKIISSFKPCSIFKECRDPNKECVDGKCQCKSNFDYIPEDDNCAKPFGASCTIFESSQEELCNVRKYLACDNQGTCSCHTEGDSASVYDQYLKACVSPPGHQCEFIAFMGVKKLCVRNSTCVHDPNREKDTKFYGICECDKGFVSKDDKCLPELGSWCELDGDCDQEGMNCVDGQCKCAEDRVYLMNEHACKLKVGKACEEARWECVENAQCQGRRNESSHWETKCECELGYQEILSNGTCVKDWHGNCMDNKIYDEMRGRCSLTVGMTCVPAGPNFCVMHAFCGTRNKCQCFEGYEVTGNGTCSKIELAESGDKSKGDKEETSTLKSIVSHESEPSELRVDGQPKEKSDENGVNKSSGFLNRGSMISLWLLLVIAFL